MVIANQKVAAAPVVNAPDPGALRAMFEEARTLLSVRQADQALVRLRDILRLCPDHPDALNLASVALGQLNMIDEAISCSRQAIARRPLDAGFLVNLANRLRDRACHEEALQAYGNALEIEPANLPALKSRLRCLMAIQRWLDVVSAVDQLMAVVDGDAELAAECGNACIGAGDHQRAMELYREAVEAEPDRLAWLLQLARLAINLEKLDLAKATGERVLEIEDHPEMRSMLASIMHRLGDLETMAHHLEAIPQGCDQAANAANLLGMMQVSQGKIRQGLDVMAATDELAPHAFPLQATRVMYLNYDPDIPWPDLKKAHVDIGRRFAESLPELDQDVLPSNLDPNRRLRIGFVSPDFRTHSVAYFIRPYFQGFDRTQFDVVAYAHMANEDAVSADFRGLATEWRNVFDLSDQVLADQIRADGIDILVDLAGYTRETRLRAFTARPAPIQMTYVGYPNTTGLPAIDYRITDWIADPEGMDDHYTETLIRLPGCFLTYAIPAHAPELEPAPAEYRDYVTFGSFNNFAKINPGVIRLWAAVMHAVPGSRLLLKSAHSSDRTAQTVIKGSFEQAGIDPARIAFSAYRQTASNHLAVYNDVDIALDTFPYNGTTTTCEALWMGVPVVTLVGDRHAARVGASLLTTVGFPAGIAESPEDYVTTARLLAENVGLLKTMRRTLRDTMMHSPLCDSVSRARTLEQAFRAVWRLWCEDRNQVSLRRLP
ncbi:MAG: tetratricopeptide repeat protein [Rhizobiales bacterium]|nr:tetratricopeptide repeat protein [Hyphomicrobiales bacterium]